MRDYDAVLRFNLRARNDGDAEHLLTILASRLADLAPGTVEGVTYGANATHDDPSPRAIKVVDDVMEHVFSQDEMTAEDMAYERAQASIEWEERHGGGL